MRVLQINSVCGIGSTGRIATDIDKVLKEQGHESYIVYGRGNAINCPNTLKIGNKLDIYFHVAKTRLLDRHGFGSRKATLSLIKKIKMLNPDIIHLHNIHGYYLNIDVLFKFLKEINKKVVWTLHDCWAFTGHCSYFDYAGCDNWKTSCNKCPQKTLYPTSMFMDQSERNFYEKRNLFTGIKDLTIVTPSQWLAQKVKQSFLSQYPIKVINNGIDLEVFKPVESDFRSRFNLSDKFIILGVANIWGKRKGYQYFVDLSKRIGREEVIVLVGLTSNQIRQLPSNIIGIEKTNSVHELAEIYSASDVFVNPTLEDNFPTTNLEALASGTPVITFNTGGSVESIDKSCGMIVDKGNADQLYSAIQKIKKLNLTPDNCMTRSKLFDKNAKFNEYIGMYKINNM